MKKICFLSTRDLDGYLIDDELAIPHLNALGFEVETVLWRAKRDWSEFAAVIIRSTWDYHHSPADFLRALTRIDQSEAHLENSFQIVSWNLEKTYLSDLERLGVPIIPSEFGHGGISEAEIGRWKKRFGTDELVIKPTIGATAAHTYRINGYDEKVGAFENKSYFVQPFIRSIETEGEYSLFFFDGEFSHGLVKRPKSRDFRVQEDFGGKNAVIEPGSELIGFARRVVESVRPTPLYSRIDIVRGEDGNLLLMELELIEPALYFRYDENAPLRFAEALNRRL